MIGHFPNSENKGPLRKAVRRIVMSAYSLHSGCSPSQAASLLTTYAMTHGFTAPRAPASGNDLAHWATVMKAPLWATRGAALWLNEHDVPLTPEQQAAVSEVMSDVTSFRMRNATTG
jgi:hypothetical protein